MKNFFESFDFKESHPSSYIEKNKLFYPEKLTPNFTKTQAKLLQFTSIDHSGSPNFFNEKQRGILEEAGPFFSV